MTGCLAATPAKSPVLYIAGRRSLLPAWRQPLPLTEARASARGPHDPGAGRLTGTQGRATPPDMSGQAADGVAVPEGAQYSGTPDPRAAVLTLWPRQR